MLELFLGFLVGFWFGFIIISCIVIARESDERDLKESEEDEK